MQSIRVTNPLVNKTSVQATVSARRSSVKVLAQKQDDGMTSRRAALALAAAALIAGTTEAAQALTAAKNSSVASKSGYVMEGTKKMGVSNKRKAKLLAKVRSNATGAAPAAASE